jgi:hypothetical protein
MRVETVSLLALLVFSCAPKSISARREHSQRLADKADESLSRADQAMTELEPDEAAKSLASTQETLSNPDASLYPEYEMLRDKLKEQQARLPAVRRAREQRDLQRAVAEQRKRVEERLQAFQKRMSALNTLEHDIDAVDDALKAASEMLDVIKDGVDLEPKDKGYLEYVRATKKAVEDARPSLTQARALAEFIQGPVKFREKAMEAFKAGKAQKDPEDRRAAFQEALGLYEKCQAASRSLLTRSPAVSRKPIAALGKKTTPEAFDTACSSEARQVNEALKKLKAQVPKKKK